MSVIVYVGYGKGYSGFSFRLEFTGYVVDNGVFLGENELSCSFFGNLMLTMGNRGRFNQKFICG